MSEGIQAPAGPAPVLFVNYHGFMGGGQVHLLAILRGLNRNRFAPEVVCCQEGPFAETLRQEDFTLTMIPFGKGKLRYLCVSLPAIWKIYWLIKRKRIRLVHVSGLQEAKLAVYAAYWARVPVVWVVAP